MIYVYGQVVGLPSAEKLLKFSDVLLKQMLLDPITK